ncbi:hypothetical protein HFN62_23505 [Rhizobium leguminosarum]|uniref:hypothetical protein n=1 Tax=Rhizobium leguminosarum TaxID=384 RepID=UPI001C951709|nr:hypothetical protein [Rhizobium leguminosarum]MBY5786680.1 hypothetical protein [Rhizobium leguminosarum]
MPPGGGSISVGIVVVGASWSEHIENTQTDVKRNLGSTFEQNDFTELKRSGWDAGDRSHQRHISG